MLDDVPYKMKAQTEVFMLMQRLCFDLLLATTLFSGSPRVSWSPMVSPKPLLKKWSQSELAWDYCFLLNYKDII